MSGLVLLFIISIPHHNSTKGIVSPILQMGMMRPPAGVSAGVWWNLGSEPVGSASRSKLFPLFHIVVSASMFTCYEKSSSPQTSEAARAWGWGEGVREVFMFSWGLLSQGALGGTFVSWAHSQPQGQRPRTHKRSEMNPDIKKRGSENRVITLSLYIKCILPLYIFFKKNKTFKSYVST